MRVFIIILLALFTSPGLIGCNSGSSTACGDQEDGCQAGYICQESSCLQVCNSSEDCLSSEACIENLCQRYDEFCSVSADCESGWYCLEGSCAPQTPLGQQCEDNEACGSGHCVEGLCCDALCDGDCMACTNAETGELTGSCAPVTLGQDPGDICAGPLACDGTGSCFNKAEGESCQENYECISGECDEGYCSPPSCGNADVQVGEDCDDGNMIDDGNGCSENCERNDVCGNEINESLYETCDDGNTADGDYCSSDCQEITGLCGDGVIQINEECDDGNSVDDGNGCSVECLANHTCGNGVLESAIELCDDFNTEAGDYCSSDCLEVTGFCGDDLVQTNEDCDDANAIDDANGCSALCTNNSDCGNNIVESYFEACDDGNNTDDGNGCSETCERLGFCGDGVLDAAFEACDDGNNSGNDYCDASCETVTGFCGDGATQGNEACDDGNTLNGDYCSADCLVEIGSCGDGVIQLNETCDDGDAVAGDGCSTVCAVEPFFTCAQSAPYSCTRVVFVDPSASGTGDGSSWVNAYNTLQPALDRSSGFFITYGYNEVWLANGVYRPSQPLDSSDERTRTFEANTGLVLLGGFAGGEINHKSRSPLTHEAVLSGDINVTGNIEGNAYHVVVVPVDQTPVIDGVIIEQGNAESGCINCNDKEGGGLLNLGGSPQILNTVFRNNEAPGNFGYGAAISNIGGVPTFVNVLVHSNEGHSAAIRNYNTEVTFINCTIANNTAQELTGGMMNTNAEVTIYNSIIWGNTALNGSSDQITGTYLPDVRYSLIAGFPGSGNISADPGLNSSYYPTNISCIDSGAFVYLPLDHTNTDDDLSVTERFPVDLAGNQRISGSEVDMGALEQF